MVIWTKNAINDLKNIYDYISLDSKYYAKVVKNEFFNKSKIINEFPKKAVNLDDNSVLKSLA